MKAKKKKEVSVTARDCPFGLFETLRVTWLWKEHEQQNSALFPTGMQRLVYIIPRYFHKSTYAKSIAPAWQYQSKRMPNKIKKKLVLNLAELDKKKNKKNRSIVSKIR